MNRKEGLPESRDATRRDTSRDVYSPSKSFDFLHVTSRVFLQITLSLTMGEIIANSSPKDDAVMNDSSENEHPELQQELTLWFEDGNVVIIAGSKAFRVHKGVLSRNTQIFQDMFTMDQPSEDEKKFGCPFVHLSDSASDVEHFLHALYDRR